MELMLYRPLWYLLLLIPLLWCLRVSLVNRSPWLKRLAWLLRALALVLVILALCRPYLRGLGDAEHRIYLLDTSLSVEPSAMVDAAENIREDIGGLSPGDSHSLYVFGDGLRELSDVDELLSLLSDWEGSFLSDSFRHESRIADSLLAARLDFPAEKRRRIDLYSDGRNTAGDLSSSLRRLEREGVTVRYHQLSVLGQPEAAVLSFRPAGKTAFFGEKMRFTLTCTANRAMSAKLRFLNRGVVLIEQPVELSGDGEQEFSCDLSMNSSGMSDWEAELLPELDTFAANNRLSTSVEVLGRARLLALHREPSRLRHFVRALREQGVDVDVRGRFGLPLDLAGMLEFDAILLADLPATDLTEVQMQALKRYVTDYGGGLLMSGSENSFGIGGYYRTPVEDVLPVVSRYEKEKEQASLALVLVIDKSGSMNGVPIAMARQAAGAAVELLSPRDQLAVVAFDGQAHLVSPMSSALNQSGIQAAIDEIAAGGGTSMYPAMLMARNQLVGTIAKVKHVIMLSDGRSQPGDFAGESRAMAEQGITLSTVALGSADRALLKQLAEIGRGRYYETMEAEAIPQIFTKETIEASRSAIREEPFYPVPVGHLEFLREIDLSGIPPLLGYVMARARPTAQVQLLTESGDPLLATARFGLGRSLAFSSDLGERWAGEWLGWSDFGRFWAQIIRTILRENSSSGIDAEILPDKDGLRVKVRRYDELGRPLSGSRWQASIEDGDGKVRDFTLSDDGYGFYEAFIEGAAGRSSTLRLHDLEYGNLKTLRYHPDYPAEYLLAAEPAPELLSLAASGESPPLPVHRSYRRQFLLLALVLILLGLVIRRI